MMRRLLALIAAWTLALAPATAWSASVGLPSLPARGTAVGTDIIPIQPNGGTFLQQITLSGLQSWINSTVKNYGAKGDGVTDDTTAIQTALNAGGVVYFPCGVYKITSTLSLNTAAQNGTIVRGSGTPAAAGTGACVTIIQPTAAVTKAFVIDGTPFASYMQHVRLENFAVDMANTASGSIAFDEKQAFDIQGDNLSVLNATPSTGRISWQLDPGAYVTMLNTFTGGLVFCNGNGVNDPTTFTLNNPDIQGFNCNWTSDISFNGGAIQPVYYAGQTLVYLAPNAAATPAAIPNPSGVYLILTGYLANVDSVSTNATDFESGGGYPATANDGTHGVLNAYPAFQASTSNRLHYTAPQFSGIYYYEIASTSDVHDYNVGGGVFRDYHSVVQWAGAETDIVNSQTLQCWIGWRVTNTCLIDASTGGATFRSAIIKPAVAGDQTLCVFNVTTCQYDFSTGGTGTLYFNNSASIEMDTGNESGRVLSLDGGTGRIRGWLSGVANIDINPVNGTGVFTGPLTSAGVNSTTGAFTAALNVVNVQLKPAADTGEVLLISKSGGTAGFDFSTNGTTRLDAINGVQINGYSDGFSTITYRFLAATGALSGNTLTLKPNVSGDGFVFGQQNAAGTYFFYCGSAAIVANSNCNMLSGANLIGYSDNFTTVKWSLNSTTGAMLSNGAAGGVGYAAGAGGAVTQSTSKATGVTLNTETGAITLNGAALASNTSVMFTLTNSSIAAADVVHVSIKSGATSLAYLTQVEGTGAGTANIVLRNVSAGSLSEAVVLSFAVIKGAIS